MSRLRPAAAGVLALAVAGCAGVPTSGRVAYVRGASDRFAEPPVRVLAAPPEHGAAPTSVVNGWLTAAASVLSDPTPRLAREFMTRDAAAHWPADVPVVEYDESTLALSQRSLTRTNAAVLVTARRIGTIAADGSFTPAPGVLRLTVPLSDKSGQWRISGAPPALLLSQDDVALVYFPLAVYYLNPARTVAVPEPVYVRAPQEGLATALVRRLLEGPARSLAPAVANAIPAGTQLIGSVPVTAGVADVNLSAPFLQVGGKSLVAAAAQVVYTLRQLPGVRDVRLAVEGTPESIPQHGPAPSIRSFDPNAAPGGVTIVQGGLLVHTDGRPVAGPADRLTGLLAGATNRAGAVAAVRAAPRGQQLLVAPAGAEQARVVATAPAFTPPSLDAQGNLWTVRRDASGEHVVSAVPGGPLRVVPAAALRAAGGIRRLTVARDGTRIAALVQQASGPAVAVAEIQRDGITSVQWLPVTDGTPLDVAWANPQTLAVLTDDHGQRGVVQITIDGSQTTPLSVSAPAGASLIAAAPGEPPLVVAPGPQGSAIWRLEPIGGWRQLARGGAPAYPG